MSSIVIQVGQCGNQIGQQFWNIGLKNSDSCESCVFTHLDKKVRSINVDAESKVVRRWIKDVKQRNINQGNVILGKRGCGTNWAIGYHGLQNSNDSLLENTLECVRKEIERCDRFSSFLLIHSLSGGTGAGLGSHLLECFQDLYPVAYKMSNVVAPHLSGESPLQHYNALLTLSHLQNFSDGVMLFQNDDVLHQMAKACKDTSVSFSNMNHYIASCIAGIYMPTDTLASKGGVSVGLEPLECVNAVCPMPQVKFFSVSHVSKRKESWDNICKTLLQTVNKYDPNGIPNKAISNLIVARGDQNNSFRCFQTKIETKIRSALNCVAWNPFSIDTWTAKGNIVSSEKESASLTVASNTSAINTYLEHVLDRAKRKYENSAYLHWFWKHGCCKDDFENAFEIINNVIDSYKSATG